MERKVGDVVNIFTRHGDNAQGVFDRGDNMAKLNANGFNEKITWKSD